MKNTFLIITAIFLIIIFIILGALFSKGVEQKESKKENFQYEQYLNKELYGTDVATIINKVIENNEKNNIQKDEKGYYIENDKNSIKVDLKMITIEKTYPMEEIYNSKVTRFVKNFNTVTFKCAKMEYHNKTGKISKIVFEEINNNSF